MKHLARCLPCLLGKRANSIESIYGAAHHVGTSCLAIPGSGFWVVNAASNRTYPPRVFCRTKRRVSRPPYQWGRDREYDRFVVAFGTKRNERDRDAIFAALRTHLLRPGTAAKAVVDLLRRHFLKTAAFATSDLTQPERAVLIEILHKVLDEWSRWKNAKSGHYVSPARLMAFYTQYGILDFQDWAFCLNSLTWTAYEALFSALDKDIDQRLQRRSDTFLLLRQLLKTWKLFFYCHSREPCDVYEVLNTEDPGLWPLLQQSSLPNVLGDRSSKYSLRLVAFAPGWNSDEESFAAQQLVCASMTSIAALSRSIKISTEVEILHPSSVVDWGMSTIRATRSSKAQSGRADSIEASRAIPGSERAPSKLSSDELSILFIVGHALNSQNVNLTLLRVALARLVPENRLGQIMADFSTFRSRAPELLEYKVLDKENSVDLTASDSNADQIFPPVIRKHSTHDPIDMLVQRLNASQSTSELESLRQIYLSLKQRNPRLRLGELEIAAYQRYLELGNPEQEREVWKASPMIHVYRNLWTSRLDFYFRRNDLQSFENVWAELRAASHKVTAADWHMKLQLYFNCGRICEALERFDALIRLSGLKQAKHSLALAKSPVTVETFNLMIRNLLGNGKLRSAMAVKQLVDSLPNIQANGTTYNLFFSYWIDRGRPKQAKKWLKRHTETSLTADFGANFMLIRHGLQQWPRAAPWADVHLVMETFDKVLGNKYHQYRVLRRISLMSDAKGRSYTLKLSPAAEADTLNVETQNEVADELAGEIPMRADGPMSPASKALCADLVSLMSAIAGEYVYPKSARMMLILWTYCVLQGLPVFRELDKVLRGNLSQLSLHDKLRLLGGDIYQRSMVGEYRNFAYVRSHLGPEFAAQRLEGLGFGRYVPLIRISPWHGFTSYNDQLLQEIGLASARARTLFLDDMNILYHELENIRNEEQTQGSKRIATEEGIWYLSDAVVDDSGSLRKIPFEPWELEPK